MSICLAVVVVVVVVVAVAAVIVIIMMVVFFLLLCAIVRSMWLSTLFEPLFMTPKRGLSEALVEPSWGLENDLVQKPCEVSF